MFFNKTDASDNAAQEVMFRKRRSKEWLENYFYGQFEEVYRNYKCVKPPYAHPEQKNKVDAERYAMCLPDTLIAMRRFVARMTAQIPQIGYRAENMEIARAVSRTLMWQWDKGRMQNVWKRNVMQAGMFGWSVIGFHWEISEFERQRRVDPFQEQLPSADLGAIAKQYQIPPQALTPEILSALVAKVGRGSGLIPVKRMYRSYVGPRGHFVFIGDCFPEPDFEDLQSSNWFIVERRRNQAYLDNLAKHFPEFREGVAKLYKQFPKGTEESTGRDATSNLRKRLRDCVNFSGDVVTNTGAAPDKGTDSSKFWTITEEHTPGRYARLRLVGEGNILLGSIDYPYSLDGKIAFAETSYIPELLGGIGDSTPRFIRGLQDVHNVMFEDRLNLTQRIARPLIATTDKRIFENPDRIKHGKGFRVVLVDRPDAFQYAPEQAAIAAAAASSAEDQEIVRALQMATGESNLSAMANQDPAQARTATGVRIMQANMDVLAKSDLTSLADTGIAGAVEIMFLMNASEMTDAVNFDPASYDERWRIPAQGKWLKAHPYDFQGDGTLTIQAGSTLADDDEAKVQVAQTLWMVANQRPDIVNPRTAAERIIESMGERGRMQEWLVPPQPPPPPEPPKKAISLSIKFETLPPEVQAAIIMQSGLVSLDVAPEQMQPPPEMGGGPAPGMPPEQQPPQLPPQ